MAEVSHSHSTRTMAIVRKEKVETMLAIPPECVARSKKNARIDDITDDFLKKNGTIWKYAGKPAKARCT